MAVFSEPARPPIFRPTPGQGTIVPIATRAQIALCARRYLRGRSFPANTRTASPLLLSAEHAPKVGGMSGRVSCSDRIARHARRHTRI